MNIRYPIYEGVYRILTIREGKAKNKKGGTGKWERVEKPQTTRSR